MTTTSEPNQIVRLPQATHMSQVTAVEQARAVAEVAAAIEVARRFPRDIDWATREAARACANINLAKVAFYRYSRGDQPISGPSVQLARELARCFGNVQYGLIELRRDEIKGESEMSAWCWDVQTNVRASTTFVSPHRMDRSEAKGGAKALTDVREIYENNANMGARRLREQIFAILPGWYTEEAIDTCYATLNADIKPEEVAERRTQMIAKFGKLGVTERALQQKIGAPPNRWTAYDLVQFGVIYKSLERHETTVEAEFGEAAGQRVIAVPAAAKPETPAATPEPPKRNTRASQALREIADIFVNHGLGGEDQAAGRLAILRRAAVGAKAAPLTIADAEQLTDGQVMMAAKNLKAAVAQWTDAGQDPAEQLEVMVAESGVRPPSGSS